LKGIDVIRGRGRTRGIPAVTGVVVGRAAYGPPDVVQGARRERPAAADRDRRNLLSARQRAEARFLGRDGALHRRRRLEGRVQVQSAGSAHLDTDDLARTPPGATRGEGAPAHAGRGGLSSLGWPREG